MNAFIKRLKSKTHWLGAATWMYGLELVQANVHTVGLPENRVGLVVIAVGLAIHVLREVTKTPVSQK